MADYLDRLDPSRFTMQAWVRVPQAPRSHLINQLPPDSRACPVGWLPDLDPENWCWVAVPESSEGKVELTIYPVCKVAAVWCGEGLQPHNLDLNPVVCRVWQQVREWFELDSLQLTGRLFESSGYGNGEPEPGQVARRIRETVCVQ